METIVLYTWLLPCKECANKIIQAFEQLTKQVLLVYTSRMQNVLDDEEEQIRDSLEAAGIVVRREEYGEYLPPWKSGS